MKHISQLPAVVTAEIWLNLQSSAFLHLRISDKLKLTKFSGSSNDEQLPWLDSEPLSIVYRKTVFVLGTKCLAPAQPSHLHVKLHLSTKGTSKLDILHCISLYYAFAERPITSDVNKTFQDQDFFSRPIPIFF